jgi:hypothetical protein
LDADDERYRQLAPGVYAGPDDKLYLDVGELLAHNSIPDTPANRERSRRVLARSSLSSASPWRSDDSGWRPLSGVGGGVGHHDHPLTGQRSVFGLVLLIAQGIVSQTRSFGVLLDGRDRYVSSRSHAQSDPGEPDSHAGADLQDSSTGSQRRGEHGQNLACAVLA